MSFDASWLALREPADKAARDFGLLTGFARAVDACPSATILDIGCGTGSTLRSAGPLLHGNPRWLLADHDPALLAEAARLTGADTHACDLNDLAALPPADFITASALFDLCSAPFIRRFTAHLAATQTGLYAALNVDGQITFTPPCRDDAAILAAVAAHQRGDKGFGPATGPIATQVLAGALSANGFTVRIAESPWIIGPDKPDLHHAFIDGLAQAAEETGLDPATWHAERMAAIAQGASCRVGHLDLLALPRGHG